jgi:hypothetical protein
VTEDLARAAPFAVAALIGGSHALVVLAKTWESEPWRPFRYWNSWAFMAGGLCSGALAYLLGVASGGVTPPGSELTIGSAVAGVVAGGIDWAILRTRLRSTPEQPDRTVGQVLLDLLSGSATVRIRLAQADHARALLEPLDPVEITVDLPALVLSSLDPGDATMSERVRRAQERIYAEVARGRDHASTRIGTELLRLVPERDLRAFVAYVVDHRDRTGGVVG